MRTLRCMQVIPFTGTGLTSADRDRVTTIRLRTNVSTSPPQTASNFRSGVENNFVVLFHFIIHFIPTIWATLRSSCNRHNVFKWRSWGSWFEALLDNDYLEPGLRCSGIYRRVGFFLLSCNTYRHVVCIYLRVGFFLLSCCTYRRVVCIFRRVVCTYRRVGLYLLSCCAYCHVVCIYRRVVYIHRRVVYIYRRVVPTFVLYLPSCRFSDKHERFCNPEFKISSSSDNTQPVTSNICKNNGSQIFQKSTSHIKTLGARKWRQVRVTLHKQQFQSPPYKHIFATQPDAPICASRVQERSNLVTHYWQNLKSDILSFSSVLPGVWSCGTPITLYINRSQLRFAIAFYKISFRTVTQANAV